MLALRALANPDLPAGRAWLAVLVLWFALLLPVTWLAHAQSHGVEDSCDLCLALHALKDVAGPAAPDPAPVLGNLVPAPPQVLAQAPRPQPPALARGPPHLPLR